MSILPLSTIFIFEFGNFSDTVVFLVVCFSSSFFTEKEKRFIHSFELSNTNNLFLSLSVHYCVYNCLSFHLWPLCYVSFFDIRLLITSWYLQTVLALIKLC